MMIEVLPPPKKKIRRVRDMNVLNIRFIDLLYRHFNHILLESLRLINGC